LLERFIANENALRIERKFLIPSSRTCFSFNFYILLGRADKFLSFKLKPLIVKFAQLNKIKDLLLRFLDLFEDDDLFFIVLTLT